jgi:predicted Zn-dependent protease
VAHVSARHAVERMSRLQLAQIGLGLGSVFSLTLGQMRDAAETGLGLLFLKYSRDDEREADALGIEYMTKSGYDPRRVPSFISLLQNLQQDAPGLPSWLSTHPDLAERVSLAREQAEEVSEDHADEALAVGRGRFLDNLHGLVYGNNPREGFVHQNTFVNPDSGFKVHFPRGWLVRNTRTAVVALPPSGGAIMRLTTESNSMTPEEHARRLAQAPEVQTVESQRTRIDGNPAFQAVYRLADSDQGFAALVGLISFAGKIYQITGFSSHADFPALRGTFESAVSSFTELREPALLNVAPNRIVVTRVKQGQTLRDLAVRTGNPTVTIEELATLNRLDPDRQLPDGFRVKLVAPGRRPG